ncbi:MAG: hypothetical protein KKG64_03575, partial [Firmicutes bacterium]|nr:hypothetical protein [Bacillota bacterium]
TFPLVFKSKKQAIHSIYESLNQEYIVLGYFHDNQLLIFENDLHKSETITIQGDDRIILIRI